MLLMITNVFVSPMLAEYSNPFGMNTKIGGIEHTVSFLNT